MMERVAKKQSPEELFHEGKSQYDLGQYTSAVLTFMKIEGEHAREGEYWTALCYLAIYEQKNRHGDWLLAKMYLTLAAAEGHREAALLLSERFDISNYLLWQTENTEAKQVGSEDQPCPAALQENLTL